MKAVGVDRASAHTALVRLCSLCQSTGSNCSICPNTHSIVRRTRFAACLWWGASGGREKYPQHQAAFPWIELSSTEQQADLGTEEPG